MFGGGAGEEGGYDTGADGVRRHRQGRETASFEPAAGRHRGQVALRLSLGGSLSW